MVTDIRRIKKKNHYETRYYLDGFCDHEGKVWTYKKLDPLRPFCKTPENTASINGFYHLENGAKVNDIEDYFSNEVETPAANAFKKLREKNFPCASDREKLSLFLGTLIVRTPCYISHFNTTLSNDLSFIKSIVGHSIELHRDSVLKNMVYLGNAVSRFLCTMKWSLVETDDGLPFITSDNFANISHPNMPLDGFHQPGLGMVDTTLVIPISKELSLFMVNSRSFKDGTIFSTTNPPYTSNGNKVDIKTLVKSWNKATYIKSLEYIFASSNSDRLKSCLNNILRQAQDVAAKTVTES